VIVDNATGLHRRIHRGRADEAETGLLQALGERLRLGRRGLPVGVAGRDAVVLGRVRPEELVQRRGLAQDHRRPGVRDRRLDLAAVADDRGVGQETLDVALAESGDPVGLEALEGGAEALTLAQDRQPGEAGLEAFEAEPLVEAALVAYRPAPLLVVVGVVPLVGGDPAAFYATSTLTTPSSTTTG